jgi:hypothetical protein
MALTRISTWTPTAKYRAVRTTVDGINFASKKEAHVYKQLKIREKAGEITDLKCQVTFPLIVQGVKVTSYRADFTYNESGKRHVVDAKGMRSGTPYDMFRLKAKLMLVLHGIMVEEL